MRRTISGARIVDPANGVNEITDLHIAEGRILALGRPPEGFQAEHTLEAAGKVLIPGLVDMAARLREPGLEHKATIAGETRAAAAAGITSLCCPPDTDPPIDSPAELGLIGRCALSSNRTRVYALGALTAGLGGERLSEMAALKEAGALGVSNALAPMASPLILRRAMEYAATHELTVFVHPIDHDLANHGCAHEGAVASRLGLPGIPQAAETAAIAQALELVEQTGVRAHFCRLSTARGATLIARAQQDGLRVSADVCAHQLFLTEIDLGDFNSLCHTLPPLRSLRDRDGLRNALSNGILSALCSDHQPHEVDAKLAPFPATEPGISALETLLPLTLKLAGEGVLTLSEAVARITCGPAGILGIEAGSLGVGCAADICIYDPEADWVLDEQSLHSQGKNTPFLGWTFTGRVTHTLLGGEIVYDAQA